MGNPTPIFSREPVAAWINGLSAANTAKDGTGTLETIFTADATNGGYLQRVIARPRGTNVASVLRIFLNNGLANTTAANNCLIAELSLPATTNSEVAALAAPEIGFNLPIPPGYRIMVALGTAVAGGYAVSAHGGAY